jgi:hypothetical protein
VVVPVGYPAEDATVPDISRKRLDEVLVPLGPNLRRRVGARYSSRSCPPPKIRIRSSTSRRTVPTHRSAEALAGSGQDLKTPGSGSRDPG